MKTKSYPILHAAANSLAKRYFYKFLRTFLIPIDYTRTKEIPAMLDLSRLPEYRDRKLRILDIGSPQILTLALCKYSSFWEITYLNSWEPELADLRQKASALGLSRLQIIHADITRFNTVSGLGTFDYIFSCSVFEHIHPEDGGDTLAAKIVPRLLKPSGVFVFSVPFYTEKFNEYMTGDVYGMKGTLLNKTFFQRFYDEKSLQDQIITPTGLRVSGKMYVGERYYAANNIKKRMSLLVGLGKRAFIMGRSFNALSAVFMEESRDYKKLKKPYLAIIAMIKD